MRSGSGTLAFLAVPLNGTILRQLSEGPKRLSELRRKRGSAPQTTVRARLNAFEENGLVSRQGRDGLPGIIECSLTSAGTDLLPVVVALERWLHAAPDEPLVFGTDAGTMAVKALAGGWSSTIIQSLAGSPHSLGQLAKGITVVSYPTLERRLGAMRLADQLVASPNRGDGIPYGVTDWLREGIGPLAAAVHWERRHFPEETPVMARLDVEAAFLLTFPQLRMSVGLTGSCRMGVEMRDGDNRLCGAIAHVDGGVVVSSTVDLDGIVDAWATGSGPAWAQALTSARDDCLGVGGDPPLAGGLLNGLRGALFSGPAQAVF
jgi:DNA-binding HxlR family transcriptional regulator